VRNLISPFSQKIEKIVDQVNEKKRTFEKTIKTYEILEKIVKLPPSMPDVGVYEIESMLLKVCDFL
jgi:hypothetical protein